MKAKAKCNTQISFDGHNNTFIKDEIYNFTQKGEFFIVNDNNNNYVEFYDFDFFNKFEPSYYLEKSKNITQKKRLSWNEYFMKQAKDIATRSTCDRANVGCVLVNDRHRIVATGYNGSAGSKTPHCDDIGHIMRDSHCIATVHAEINCITECAREGKSTNNCTAYVTHFPCLNCTKALIQAGIKSIYYENDYRIDDYAVELLKMNGILYSQIIIE